MKSLGQVRSWNAHIELPKKKHSTKGIHENNFKQGKRQDITAKDKCQHCPGESETSWVW